MKLISASKETWIPEWLNNLNLPKAEQVIIHLTYPTVEDKEGVSQIEYIRGRDGDVESFKITYDTDRLLKNHVPKIENLIDEVDGKAKNITTGAMLLQSRNKSLGTLVQKIVAKLTSADDIGDDEKN